MCVQNLKFVALPVSEIIGSTPQKFGSPWIRPHYLFSKHFNGLDSANVLAKFEIRSLTHS